MTRPIVYDLTRLASRILNDTPNGIDRVDIAFAKHFLSNSALGTLYLGKFGHHFLENYHAQWVVEEIDARFGENDEFSVDPVYSRIVKWLNDEPATQDMELHALVSKTRGTGLNLFSKALLLAPKLARTLNRQLPRGAAYVCVSQYPLSVEASFRWLSNRPDVKPVFFIHDLLPLEYPEFFKVSEQQRHERRLINLARFGAAAIVATQVVKQKLQLHLEKQGRGNLPILVTEMPISETFFDERPPLFDSANKPYFVLCGTLEPRKNHLMLINVWRELILEMGENAPKLVFIGADGWQNENIRATLERSSQLRRHLLWASCITTPMLKALLKNARAALFPSFAEGFGLPLVEAQALGVPVIASDIPVFHEIAKTAFTAVSPIDGRGWLRAIRTALDSGEKYRRNVAKPNLQRHVFAGIDDFISTL